MNILLYSQSLDPKSVSDSVENQEVTTVNSYLRLAERIVEERNLLCVLVQIDGLDEECQKFLSSLKENFPILNVGVITQDQEVELPEGYSRIGIKVERDAFGQEIEEFISSLAATNRRQYLRFSWPIKGSLSFDGKEWNEFPVHSISAGGAFLESSSSHPKPGTVGILRVVFGNFKMVAHCEILEARHASSNMPPGFAVRFTQLSEASRLIIDRIVHEALVNNLVAPEEEPSIPSLDETELTPDFEQL
jgi:hypothetical protein